MDYTRLRFVYRTDANPVSIIGEFLREHVLDAGPECSLCHLTYDTVRKKPEWNRFIRDLPIASSFHLRNVFVRRYRHLAAHHYPAVFIEDASGELHELLGAEELAACETVDDLTTAITRRLGQLLTPRHPAP